MGTQCKSATLPDAVNPFLGRPIVSLDSKTHEFADVWEDRVGEDKSEDLPFASSNMCLRDYGHGNLIYNVIVRQYYCTFSCCGYAFILCCMPVQAQTKASWLCVSYQ